MAPAESKAALAPESLRAMLGDDLYALVGALPARVLGLTPITSLNARRSSRASFRIALEDGSVVKGRRLDSAFEAQRVARLTRHLGLPFIPAIIAQRGVAVIEPWTEGQALAGAAPDESDVRACGALLGMLHAALPPADAAKDIEIARGERLDRLGVNLRRLVSSGRIDAAAERRIRTAAEPVPSIPKIGLIHGDFCPENLIRTEDGAIVAIDNETLRFEALDYDLARSWYRWRIDGSRLAAFLDGYATMRSPSDFQRHFSYWAICALVDSAVFRLGAEIAGADAVLRQLESFVENHPAAGKSSA